jgi:hypothetical protein
MKEIIIRKASEDDLEHLLELNQSTNTALTKSEPRKPKTEKKSFRFKSSRWSHRGNHHRRSAGSIHNEFLQSG